MGAAMFEPLRIAFAHKYGCPVILLAETGGVSKYGRITLRFNTNARMRIYVVNKINEQILIFFLMDLLNTDTYDSYLMLLTL